MIKIVDLDPRDLQCLDQALNALAGLHDFGMVGNEHVRVCLCSEASAWRQARKVLNAWKLECGLKVRLLDRV